MISKNNILNLDARQKIYSFIDKNPGLHQREISRRMGIPKSTLMYHIKFLKKLELIDETQQGNSKYYYPTKKMGLQEKQILSLFRREVPYKIFLYLLFSFACSQIELSRELELPRTTVSRNINKMMKMGLIEEATTYKDRVYPIPNKKTVYVVHKPIRSEKFYRRKNQKIIELAWRVLIAHKDSLKDSHLIEAYIDFLVHSGYTGINEKGERVYTKKGRPKYAPQEGQRIKDVVDRSVDVFFDLFGLPFCA